LWEIVVPDTRHLVLNNRVEHMFMSQYEHTIDSKGRLTIPVRFREHLVEGAYITQGFDQNLMVLTSPDFNNITKRIDEMSLTNPDARRLKRRIFGFAEQVDLDKLGRILIPGFLRETAALQDSAIVVGMSAYFEIWSPERWIMQCQELQNPEADEQRYAAFDLPIR
jgi:MraZ protein